MTHAQKVAAIRMTDEYFDHICELFGVYSFLDIDDKEFSDALFWLKDAIATLTISAVDETIANAKALIGQSVQV